MSLQKTWFKYRFLLRPLLLLGYILSIEGQKSLLLQKDFLTTIKICVPKINKSRLGLEQHSGE